MNINDFVILPGSKTGTSVRLKTKTVRELQLEKVQLEKENKEMAKKLHQLQFNMSREKEERKKLSPYHWKSGQAGPMTIQAQVLSQTKENWKKVSSGKVKLQILKEPIQEPVKGKVKPEVENAIAHTKSEVKGRACGQSEFRRVLLDPPSESTCTGLGNEDRGLLLNGAYNEEESAQAFQEALLQWRKGSSAHREHLPASEVPAESVGICEVQTSVTVLEEPIHVEFKQDGLSYMEKLLLKKYRRTPVDQISDRCMEDLKPVQTLSVHQAVTGGGEGNDDDDDDDMDDLSVEEMKRFWASLFRVEESNTSESAESESSLKIEFLDGSHSTDLEESSNYLVVANGAKEEKTEPLEQCGRNPVPSEEISQEQMVVCSHLDQNAVPKESIKAETERESLGPWKPPEGVSDPAELRSNNPPEPQLQQTSQGPPELGSGCNRQGLGLPGMKKSSALQDVARRQKSISTPYRGLEGFFGAAAEPRAATLAAHSALAAASSPGHSSFPFPGDGQWVAQRSCSEHADGSVVQGVLQSHLNGPSRGFKAQKELSPLLGLWRAGPEKHPSLTPEGGTSSSKHLEICGNATDFQQNLELKEHDTGAIFGVWDESQVDEEEEMLEDKQQVLALH
ncbi:zinc finger B-box domain-containing protein 1 [Pithys albifrons albifrons]|uniref:zinc finger B-box domain-containing protein 1 n=1 Tax=Pithys albifrons albifrons TaxID=3385563 RepID=UPI003A5D023D